MVTIPPRKSKVPNILGDWDDVRFFLAVAKTGSFSAAWAPSCSTATATAWK